MLYWCGWKNTPKLYTLEMVNKHTSSRMAQQMLQRRAYLNYHRIFGILLVRTALPIGGEMNCCANTKDGTLLSAPINWRNDASSAIRQCATILQRLYFPASISRAFSPNWYDNAYSFCFTGAETEIDKIKDDGKIYRETNPDRRGPRQIGTVWHIPDPPTFWLPTTFNINRFWQAFCKFFIMLQFQNSFLVLQAVRL